MRALLDTHVFLWAIQAPQRLSPVAAEIFQAPEHELYLSIASLWEVTIKVRLGKLDFSQPGVAFLSGQARLNRLRILPIKLSHLRQLESLPLHHRDPFDRILVAQAQAEEMALVSHDRNLRLYPIEIIW